MVNRKEAFLVTENWNLILSTRIRRSAAAGKDKREMYKHRLNVCIKPTRPIWQVMRGKWWRYVARLMSQWEATGEVWFPELSWNRCAVEGHTGDCVSGQMRHDWFWKANIRCISVPLFVVSLLELEVVLTLTKSSCICLKDWGAVFKVPRAMRHLVSWKADIPTNWILAIDWTLQLIGLIWNSSFFMSCFLLLLLHYYYCCAKESGG